MKQQLLGVPVDTTTKSDILEKIKKYLSSPKGFFHIVSLNPENLVLAQENAEFRKALSDAQIHLVDGAGTVLGAWVLERKVGQRFPGVDLMNELLKVAGEGRLRVVFIGGRTDLAKTLADCYGQTYPQAEFFGFEGIKNIKKPARNEEERTFSIVTGFKPHFLFAAFGSPDQELWLWRNRQKLQGIVCMGVGGGFDFLAGSVKRAPRLMRALGLEWLFRLTVQPWRLRRQLKLPIFAWLILKEKFHSIANPPRK